VSHSATEKNYLGTVHKNNAEKSVIDTNSKEEKAKK
jgi:hypothetical protein